MKIVKFNEMNEGGGLKMQVKTLNIVDSSDLEDYIEKIYGIVYETVAEQEWNNDSNYDFTVNGVISDYDKESVEKIRNGKNPGMYKLHVILNLMATDGLIPKGEYLIEVCW